MSKIEILIMSDWNDCEQCGGGSESGGIVKIDGKVAFQHIPYGSCYDNRDIYTEGLLVEALKALGHTVEISSEEVDDYGEDDD